MIVVQRYDFFRFVTGENTDSRGALAGFAKLDNLLHEHYELATSIEDFELYERRK